MPAMARFLFVVAALAGCVPLSGGSDGGPTCTDLACGPSYQVKFTRAAWRAGTYRIDVTADGVAGFCDISIPMSCEAGPRCTGASNWVPMVAGCALDPGQQSIDGILFERATPMNVTVRVSQADQPLGLQTFSPSYHTSAGTPGCNLSCTQAPADQLSLAQ
jgi:hypothetical protein